MNNTKQNRDKSQNTKNKNTMKMKVRSKLLLIKFHIPNNTMQMKEKPELITRHEREIDFLEWFILIIQ